MTGACICVFNWMRDERSSREIEGARSPCTLTKLFVDSTGRELAFPPLPRIIYLIAITPL
eukprot:6341105-Pyramimonas_sp.AAC.1